ncbi:MAG: metalloregulator ArsR/SmtB family transcription factor [Chitinophagales bacterium]|nr:metalloregulator ArsR/SmtB family transcription factor [Chitinophagales bacterium]MDW8418272.1 metalloregulator ArsR/SmtB family transcription factor [Chitinophagales bacterium]
MYKALDKHLPLALHVLRAIAHPLRFRIVCMAAEKQPLPVQNIYDELKITPAIASQHLRILKNAGILHGYRKHRHVYYAINRQFMLRFCDSLAKYFSSP